MASKYSVSVLISAIDKATAPIRRIQQQLDAFKKTEGIRRMGAALNSVRTSFQNVTKEAGLFAMRMGALAAGGVGLFAAFLKPASAMENLRFRLKQLYGDKDKALAIFKFIQDFAIKSPYTFEGITEGLLKMKGQGFDNLKQFQNIMNYLAVYVPDEFRANNAIIQLSQAWGKAKLQMADIRPMIEAGLPVWSLLEKVTGKNTAQLMKMSEKGTITRDIMLKMFTLMGKKSGGAGNEIFDLWTTKLSNLGDVWVKFADNVMNTAIGDITVFKAIKNDVDKITQFLNEGFKGKAGQEFAQTLMDIYTTAKELFVTLFPLAKEVTALMKAFTQSVGASNALKILIGLLAAPFVISVVAAVGSIIGMIATFAAWATSAEVVWAALGVGIAVMELLGGPVFWIITLVGLLAAAAAAVYMNWNAISGWFVGMWEKWGGAIRTIFPIVGFWIDLIDLIAQNWHKIPDAVNNAVNAMKQKLREMFPWLKQVMDWVGQIGSNFNKWADKQGNVNQFTGRKNFDYSAGYLPPMRAGMAQPVRMGPLNAAAIAAAKPKKDQLDVTLKVDLAKNAVQVVQAKNRGDSSLNFFWDMGFSQ